MTTVTLSGDFKSPGRINLIGEHTDYNEGFVLPATVNKATYLAIKPNEHPENLFRFYSVNLDEFFQTKSTEKSDVHWVNYILGTIF